MGQTGTKVASKIGTVNSKVTLGTCISPNPNKFVFIVS